MSFDLKAARAAKPLAVATPLVAAGLFLSGCIASPTYGTDKTANEQLMTDVSSLVSLAPKRKAPIKYTPRPELVRPASSADLVNLPVPQEGASTGENGDWPESPEQRRARVLKEIADKENSRSDSSPRAAESGVRQDYDSPIIADDDMAPESNSYLKEQKAANYRAGDSGIRPEAERVSQREEVKKRLAESRQGSATTRKYLSEPPLEYRQAAATAPQGDIGEDESRKARAAKKAARKKGTGGWREWLPW